VTVGEEGALADVVDGVADCEVFVAVADPLGVTDELGDAEPDDAVGLVVE
jgi:hypothetical protein